jgi:hypothetical protein
VLGAGVEWSTQEAERVLWGGTPWEAIASGRSERVPFAAERAGFLGCICAACGESPKHLLVIFAQNITRMAAVLSLNQFTIHLGVSLLLDRQATGLISIPVEDDGDPNG